MWFLVYLCDDSVQHALQKSVCTELQLICVEDMTLILRCSRLMCLIYANYGIYSLHCCRNRTVRKDEVHKCHLESGSCRTRFYFMNDNARPRKVPFGDDFLEGGGDIYSAEFLACSPKLSFVQYFWDALGSHETAKQVHQDFYTRAFTLVVFVAICCRQ